MGEDDVGGEGDGGGGGGRGGEVRHLEVGMGFEVGVEGADEGGHGLDEEEEGRVSCRQLEGLRHNGRSQMDVLGSGRY